MNTKHDLGLPSANKVSTHQHNRDERLPDITWHTKSMLRKLLYYVWDEKIKAKSDYERVLEDNIRLHRQRTYDLEELGRQKDLIIDLYSKLNAGTEASPLTIAG